MKELVIQSWCDNYHQDHVRAEHSLTFGVDANAPLTVDLCDECFNALGKPLVGLYDEFGVKPEDTTAKKLARQPRAVSTGSATPPDPGFCPLCRQEYNWLSTHANSKHHLRPEEADGGMVCPECRTVLPTTRALAMHVSDAHNSRLQHLLLNLEAAKPKRARRKP